VQPGQFVTIQAQTTCLYRVLRKKVGILQEFYNFLFFLVPYVKNTSCSINILELSANQPSMQRLLAQIITIICYNINKDWVFDIGCVALHCQNSLKRLRKGYVREK